MFYAALDVSLRFVAACISMTTVVGAQVLQHSSSCKALAVKRYAQLREVNGLGLSAGEHCHIVRPRQALGDKRLGVVVALQDEDADVGLVQPAHGAGEIEAGRHILPVAVEKIPGDD